MSASQIDQEIQELIEQAKKRMVESGRNYDGPGEAIESQNHQGPYLGPRNDIEYRKLIKEIRNSGQD